jgi:DNA-binding response OmpR family regulator
MDMTQVKILAVEDQADYQMLITRTLEKEGFEVSCVASGEQVMEWVRGDRLDLMLLDLGLPGIDGLEVYRRLKQDEDLMHIPVLMLTARTDEVDRIVGFELGADDYE